MGKPAPGTPITDGSNIATAKRWWCEGFDEYLGEDLSDYVEVDVEGKGGKERVICLGWG